MALTRPTAYQINTVSTTISDPLTVLNQGSTAANIDIGFILNRSPSANVAIVWQASSNQFILANTSSSGSTNANITVSNYANLRAGNVLATTITTTNLVGDANITVTGSIIPSANVTYDLGSPTQRWREGWFSGSTIHIGAESISVDNNGKWTFTSDGAAVELGKNNEFNPPSANISGNVTATNYLFADGTLLMTVVDTMIGTANTNMQGQVAELISTANVNLKGYVDAANTIQSNQIAGANSAVTTANTNMKGYVDGQISTTSGAATTANTNMKGYVDGQISTTSSSVTTANTNMKGYVDGQISTTTTTAITTANTNLKGYVDGQITNLVGGSPATLDTLNEIAVALGNDANLSVTLTSLITGVQGNITAANSAITTANTNMKGYTDNLVSTANVNLKGYVDGQISTTSSSVTTANTNMQGYVDAANTIQSGQISTTSSSITTANTNMKGYVDGQISTTSSSITTANTNMKGYVDNGLSSLSSNRINANASNVTVTASFVNVAINSSNVASFSSTGIGGTLTTAAQTNITSVGTLTSLAVSGAITVNSGAAATAIVNGATTGVGNIGSSTVAFNTVFAKSTSAQYADLAEVYRSDRNYIPGTVVVFGGTSEVTVSLISHDPAVAGVVSTNPAYLMNDREDGVAVALQGRVPCRVLGPVSRGDRVVTSDVRGVAERLDMTKYQPGCIIGKALGSIPDGEIATIEVVVGRN